MLQAGERTLAVGGGSKTGPDATCNAADTGLLAAACTALRMVLAALCGLGGLWTPESQGVSVDKACMSRLAGGEPGQWKMLLHVFFSSFFLLAYPLPSTACAQYHSLLPEGTWALGSNPYFCLSLFN